jgi:hypothetical protein
MLVGLAQLGPRPAPPGLWEQGFLAAARSKFKPDIDSWEALVEVVRREAGMEEEGEQLPEGPWMDNMLLSLGRMWGLAAPAAGGSAPLGVTAGAAGGLYT